MHRVDERPWARTRASLLERLKDWGNNEGWQEFFDIYGQLIYHFALKRGLNDAEAEDVLQETMVAVAKSIPTLKYDRQECTFKTWLLRIARNKVADQYRKRPLASEFVGAVEDDFMDFEVSNPNAKESSGDWETVWDEQWRLSLLDAAWTKVKRGLDPQQSQMFDLYVNKEWKPDRVAKALDVTVSSVYVAKHRITGLVRKEFDRLEKMAY